MSTATKRRPRTQPTIDVNAAKEQLAILRQLRAPQDIIEIVQRVIAKSEERQDKHRPRRTVSLFE
jgi:hypothetical protein